MIITSAPVEEDKPTVVAPLSATVKVSMTVEDKAKITADAKKARQSVSAYCRHRILGH